VKALLIWLGFLTAWLIVLPPLIIVGGVALFLYAVLAEMVSLVTGARPPPAVFSRS
jgi:hypothetical protein